MLRFRRPVRNGEDWNRLSAHSSWSRQQPTIREPTRARKRRLTRSHRPSAQELEMTNKTQFNIGYAIVALLGISLVQYFFATATQLAPIPYSQFRELLRNGKIESVGVSERFLQGTLRE